MVRRSPRPARKAKTAATPPRPALVFRDFVRQLERLSDKAPARKPEGGR